VWLVCVLLWKPFPAKPASVPKDCEHVFAWQASFLEVRTGAVDWHMYRHIISFAAIRGRTSEVCLIYFYNTISEIVCMRRIKIVEKVSNIEITIVYCSAFW